MSNENVHCAAPRSRKRNSACSSLLILIVALTLSVITAIAGPEPHEDFLDPDNWPITIEGAVHDLLKHIPLSEKLKIKQTKKENTISLYFDMGTQIRNRYGLWRGNDKLIVSACGSRCHPDDATMKIIEAVWRELQARRP
jgi:hypothetical protein